MARLLASERGAARQHLLHDVLVAHARADEANAKVAQGEFETDVAHHGRDHRLAREPLFVLELAGAEQEDGVAVDDLAAMVHENRAVAIPVERDAQLPALLDDGAGKHFGVRRAAAEIDVAAIGPVADHGRVETQSPKETGCHGCGGAVRTVDDQGDAG